MVDYLPFILSAALLDNISPDVQNVNKFTQTPFLKAKFYPKKCVNFNTRQIATKHCKL